MTDNGKPEIKIQVGENPVNILKDFSLEDSASLKANEGLVPLEKSLPEKVVLQSVKQSRRIVDLIDIKDEHKRQAEEVAKTFDFNNTSSIITFGAAAQSKYTDTLKTLLGHTTIKDVGLAGDITLEITKGIEMVGLDKMKSELTPWTFRRFLCNLPFIGKYLSFIQRFAARKEEINNLVDGIKVQVMAEMKTIVVDNARLDIMFGEVNVNFYELSVYIYAGELALLRGKKEYDELWQKAADSGDAVQISKANLFREQLVAFDSRLLRIKTAYAKAPIVMQKILTTQQAGRIELNNLMESLLFDLPAFMESILLFLSLYNIEKAQQHRQDREKLRERLEELEGTFLDRVAVSAKQDQARGAREVQLVEAAANKIMATVKRLKELDDQNAKIRRDSETLLVDIVTNFQETMKGVNSPEAMQVAK